MNLQNLCIAVVIASIPFQILRLLAGMAEKFLNPLEEIHSEMVKTSFRSKWSLESVVLGELFEVALPAFFFALILPFLPLTGIKAGIFLEFLSSLWEACLRR